MIDMIAYISVPYSLQSLTTQNSAINYLNQHIAQFVRKNPRYVGVNALYSSYRNPNGPGGRLEDTHVFPVCRSLIASADIFVVVRRDGWDYSDIISNETAYAHYLKKPIVYEPSINLNLFKHE